MGVNNVLSGQTKKKQVGRETGKRERKEREMEKEWQPFTQTWYMFSFKKITWPGAVFWTQRFCQAKVFYKAIKICKQIIWCHEITGSYYTFFSVSDPSIVRKNWRNEKKKMDNSNVARNWSHICWKDLKVWILWLINCFFL